MNAARACKRLGMPLMAFLAVALSVPARAQSSRAAAEVRRATDRIILGTYIEGLPADKLDSLGARAIPRLVEILADTTLKPYWYNATAAVGYIGDRRSFEILRHFIWDRFKAPVDGPTYVALTSAVSVLGYTCLPGDTKVESVLEAHAYPQGWSDIAWIPKTQDHAKALSLLTNLSVTGLGYCGSKPALDALVRISKSPYYRTKDRQRMLASRLELQKQVSRMGGYRAYMKQERARYPH